MTWLLRRPLFDANPAIFCSVLIFAVCWNISPGLLFIAQPGGSTRSTAFVFLERSFSLPVWGVVLVALGAAKIVTLLLLDSYVWTARLLSVGAGLFFWFAINFARSAIAQDWVGSVGACSWSGVAFMHLVIRYVCVRPRPPRH